MTACPTNRIAISRLCVQRYIHEFDTELRWRNSTDDSLALGSSYEPDYPALYALNHAPTDRAGSEACARIQAVRSFDRRMGGVAR